MTNEEWKDIDGYSGIYQVSNLGNIQCIKVITGKDRVTKSKNLILKPEVTRLGYLRICLQDNGRKRILVHRLVAQAFVKNPNNLPEINHKDGDKSNNKSSNLEWATRKLNIKHAYANGLKTNLGEKNPFFGKKHSSETKMKISISKKQFHVNNR